MFNTRNTFGAIGVVLFLIALYLVLVHGTQAVRLVSAMWQGGNTLARTLQGR